MLLHPELLIPLAEAVEIFANGPPPTTTAEVHALFLAALKKVAQPMRPKLQTLEPHEVNEFRENHAELKRRLADLAVLDPATPRLTSQTAQQLRADLAPHLRRAQFFTAVDFSEHGAALRLYPTVFGVQAAYYLVIAAVLEAGAKVRIRKCAEDTMDCPNFVIHTGGQGRPRLHCITHNAERDHRKKEK